MLLDVLFSIALGAGPSELGECSAEGSWEDRIALARGDSAGRVLDRLGLDGLERQAVLQAARPFKDLARLRVGEEFLFRVDGGMLASIVYPMDRWNESLLVLERSTSGTFAARVEQRALVRSPRATTAEVSGSLWSAGVSAGLSPLNLMELAKAFAYDIDFNTEVQHGDRFRVVFEELRDSHTGELVRHGDLLAAEYVRSSGERHAVYRFLRADGDVAFYDETGGASRTRFLKSPLEFSSVSSRFGRRFHPVLKRWRAHRGTDYAAGRGTPVRSVGDGLVEFVGRRGGYGKHVRIRHDGRHTSSYSHLSAFGVARGDTVRQGDTIGRVGSTGLATGPHLHFEFEIDGRQVDYPSMEFDSAGPVEHWDLQDFERVRDGAQRELDAVGWAVGTCEPGLR